MYNVYQNNTKMASFRDKGSAKVYARKNESIGVITAIKYES